MPKLSDTITIVKHTPDGRRITREVTGEEFIHKGWADQGWAATAGLQQEYEKYKQKQEQQRLEQMPINYLRVAAGKVPIVKKLPNGKWARLTVDGIDYEKKGWMNNGWFIPKWALSKASQSNIADTPTARTRLTNQIMGRSDYWRPKRSIDQARSLVQPYYNVIGQEVGHNFEQDAKGVMEYKKQYNPKWRDWMSRAHGWILKKRRKAWRKTNKLTGYAYKKARQALLWQYHKRHPAPQAFIDKEWENPYTVSRDTYRIRNFGPMR